MRYGSIDEQNETFLSILKENKELMCVLDFLAELELPNFYIASGAVFQTVWNYLEKRPLNAGIKDVDIVYYDKEHLTSEYEKQIEDKIIEHCSNLGLNYEFDIHNEARMHLWKKANENPNIDYYENAEDAIDQWIATVQAIGVTKRDGKIEIYAPYGLSDVFSRTVRPIKHENNMQELYQKKATSWENRFDNLNVVEW